MLVRRKMIHWAMSQAPWERPSRLQVRAPGSKGQGLTGLCINPRGSQSPTVKRGHLPYLDNAETLLLRLPKAQGNEVDDFWLLLCPPSPVYSQSLPPQHWVLSPRALGWVPFNLCFAFSRESTIFSLSHLTSDQGRRQLPRHDSQSSPSFLFRHRTMRCQYRMLPRAPEDSNKIWELQTDRGGTKAERDKDSRYQRDEKAQRGHDDYDQFPERAEGLVPPPTPFSLCFMVLFFGFF